MTIAVLDDRAVLRIAGADARSFLQGLLTHDVALLSPERPLYAGLLSAQGKALFDMILFDGGDSVLIDVAANRAEALAKRLTLYRMRKAVTIEPALLHVHAGWAGDEAGHTPDPRTDALGSRWLAPEPAAGTEGAAAYEAHRLATGVPGSADIGEDELLWLETGADLLDGVSFTKGCYVGQENTARMHYRDNVRRRLVPVRLAGAVAPGADYGIKDDAGRATGTLRSALGNLGMAHLRLEAAKGPLVLADGGPALEVLKPAWLVPALDAAAGETN